MKINKIKLIFFIIFMTANILTISAEGPIDHKGMEAREEALKSRLEQTSDSNEIFAIGEELFKLGKIEEAGRAFRKDQTSPDNLIGAATCFRLSGNYKDSIKYYSEAINRGAYLGEAYFGRALSYRGIEEYGKSVSDLKTSLNYQKNQYTYAGLGDLYILLGRDGDAKNILEEGNKLYPDSSLIKSLLLRAYKN